MKAETVRAISAGSITSESLHDAFIMERLGIDSWADYQTTPQEVLAYRIAIKDTFDDMRRAEAASQAAARR